MLVTNHIMVHVFLEGSVATAMSLIDGPLMLTELFFRCPEHSTDQFMHLQTAPVPLCMLNSCLGDPL